MNIKKDKNIIQFWMNPSWRAFHFFKRGFPDGYTIRVGRLVIKLFGTKKPNIIPW